MGATSRIAADTCRDLGVPFLNIGMDMADKRWRSVDDIRAHISRFFTTMGLG